MKNPASLRAILTPLTVFRTLLGWCGFFTMLLTKPLLSGGLPTLALFAVLAVVVGVIVVCAFGVVAEAGHLASRLGDPYGTLVLTISIVFIEIILICAVMLGPGKQPTIARDSVMSATMISLTLIIGLAFLAGGMRNRRYVSDSGSVGNSATRFNPNGVSAYITFLIVLVSVAFAYRL